MAKSYQFRINVQRGEPYPGGMGVAYGAGCCLYREEFSGTLAQGLEELSRVSANVNGPHAAFLGMLSASDRKPPGFNAAQTIVYKREV